MTGDERNLTLRTLDVLEALSGFAARGCTNGDLAAAVKTSPSNISRAMAQLIAKGWARKGEGGRFWPTPHFCRLAFRVMADFDTLAQRVEDMRQSMTGVFDTRAAMQRMTGQSPRLE
jgi:DNA-binding IclR family transcriptional regulator